MGRDQIAIVQCAPPAPQGLLRRVVKPRQQRVEALPPAQAIRHAQPLFQRPYRFWQRQPRGQRQIKVVQRDQVVDQPRQVIRGPACRKQTGPQGGLRIVIIGRLIARCQPGLRGLPAGSRRFGQQDRLQLLFGQIAFAKLLQGADTAQCRQPAAVSLTAPISHAPVLQRQQPLSVALGRTSGLNRVLCGGIGSFAGFGVQRCGDDVLRQHTALRLNVANQRLPVIGQFACRPRGIRGRRGLDCSIQHGERVTVRRQAAQLRQQCRFIQRKRFGCPVLQRKIDRRRALAPHANPPHVPGNGKLERRSPNQPRRGARAGCEGSTEAACIGDRMLPRQHGQTRAAIVRRILLRGQFIELGNLEQRRGSSIQLHIKPCAGGRTLHVGDHAQQCRLAPFG